MIKRLQSLFSNPLNWFAFILLAILLRGIVWIYFGHLVHVHLSPDETISKYFVKDDYIYFFSPVDNYFRTGHYTYLDGVPFTGRMPGYSIVYFLARFIFSQHIALWAVIVLQFLLSAISVYALSLVAYYIFNNSKRIFYFTYGLYILAVYPGFFDFFIIAESFSVSAFIFSLYYLSKYIYVESQKKYLLLAGFFLTWTIFTREYTGMIIILFPSVLFFYLFFTKKELFAKTIWNIFLFCLPFALCETAWVTRNYLATNKIILLTTPEEQTYGKLYSAPWQVIDNLVYTWGENASPFDNTTLGYYYRKTDESINYKFPPPIFHNVSTYNADSLVMLKALYKEYYTTSDSIKSNALEKAILSRCERYKNDYISHNEFAYWVIKPLKDIKYLVFFSGTGYLPLPSFHSCSLIGKLIKIIFSLLYYYILITAVAGAFLYFFFYRKKPATLPLLIILSFTLIVLTLIFIGTVAVYSSIQEPRYFVHCFAVIVPFSAFFTDKVFSRLF